MNSTVRRDSWTATYHAICMPACASLFAAGNPRHLDWTVLPEEQYSVRESASTKQLAEIEFGTALSSLSLPLSFSDGQKGSLHRRPA
jgi:hypothetical protein